MISLPFHIFYPLNNIILCCYLFAYHFFYQKQFTTQANYSLSLYRGEPTNINVELLFRDLFVLRDRFKELGMVIKNGEVYLPDLEGHDV